MRRRASTREHDTPATSGTTGAPERAHVRGGRDGGFSLVDIVMAISLIGLVVIPLIEAVFTTVHASAVSREVTQLENVLQDAADRVNRAPTGCDYTVYVQAAALAKGWQAEQASATYQRYVPGASALASDPGTWVDGACQNNVRTPGLVQLVTIRITSESGRISRTLKVVKSDV